MQSNYIKGIKILLGAHFKTKEALTLSNVACDKLLS